MIYILSSEVIDVNLYYILDYQCLWSLSNRETMISVQSVSTHIATYLVDIDSLIYTDRVSVSYDQLKSIIEIIKYINY